MSYSVVKNKKKNEMSQFTVIVLSFVSELLLFTALCCIFAFVITKKHTDIFMMQLFVILSSATASFFVAIYCSIRVRTKKLICGMIVSAAASIAEFLLILCFCAARLTWQTYMIFPAVLITALAGCIVGANTKRK